VVQKGLQLETGFRAVKRGPGKEAETETHYGCLQAVELILMLLFSLNKTHT